MNTLDLALIGNGTIGPLVDALGSVVWGCFPRFDGDPVFCSLLQDGTVAAVPWGSYSIELLDLDRHEQAYQENTPILVTRLWDAHGSGVEITDFCPRFRLHDRVVAPMMLIRTIRPLGGTPRIRIRVRPARDHGAAPAPVIFGSNHLRYQGTGLALRLTSSAPVTALLEERPLVVDGPITLILGPDETIDESINELGRRLAEQTTQYWRDWVRSLAIPYEWQEAVIRAAITLKLNTFEDTGAIVAAVTTSIPEAPSSGRNWDYRYCWLRDAYFVVGALNRLGATRIMERYLRYIVNVVAGSPNAELQPVYAVNGGVVPDEIICDTLAGYRGMGPVRLGNQASAQVQHDVYGAAILAASQMFADRRLAHPGDDALFRLLERLGDRAVASFDQPDAGIWELRGIARIHTYSSAMCWAASDRLARIARRLGLGERADHWRAEADRIRDVILRRAWNADLGSFTSTFDGKDLDAALLHLHAIGLVAGDDPRFIGTVDAIDRQLRRGDFLLRYDEQDDFGYMTSAFLVCTFWHIEALAVIGRHQQARLLFEKVLTYRNRHGLFAEDIDPATGEQWGNFVQTYSMVGVINCAQRLSRSWEDAP
ncbi:MAG: glycoside hydrolase family 15 protein [Gemmatimonadota bacterium]